MVFSVLCENYKHQKNKGEVAAYSMIKFKSYFVKVFHQWKSSQMNINDKSTWNTSDKEISKVIKDISSLKIHFKK